MKVRLEKALSAHRYLYYRDNGRVYMHSDRREPQIEGTLGAYMRDSQTGRVVRFDNGNAILVTAVEYV